MRPYVYESAFYLVASLSCESIRSLKGELFKVNTEEEPGSCYFFKDLKSSITVAENRKKDATDWNASCCSAAWDTCCYRKVYVLSDFFMS